MSLSDLTSTCFQNGISASKWAALCRLHKEKMYNPTADFESDLSNSVLSQFQWYPADSALLSYLDYALHPPASSSQPPLLSLPTLTSSFLQSAKSPNLSDVSTLAALCKLIQSAHFTSGLPPNMSLVRYGENASTLLATVSDALSLVRKAYTLPPSPFHDLIGGANALLGMLLSCVGDVGTLSTAQAAIHFREVGEILTQVQVGEDVRPMLENLSLNLSMVFSDDAKVAQEAQMMQTMQLSFNREDIYGPNSEDDVVTCGALLRHLMATRSTAFGAGNETMSVALIVALFRWMSWSPPVFYTQLFLAALHCVAQSNTQYKSYQLWKTLIIARLPHLLALTEQVLMSDSLTEATWRSARQLALSNISHQADLLMQCDVVPSNGPEGNGEGSGSNSTSTPTPFLKLLLTHYAYTTKFVEPQFAAAIYPGLPTSAPSIIEGDAMENGMLEMEMYIDVKLHHEPQSHGGAEGGHAFLKRAAGDLAAHAPLAAVVLKRFIALSQTADVEGLAHLCRLLTSHELVLDIVAIHEGITEVVAALLAFVEDFDCDVDGDPQAAVSHFGEVVLFLQWVVIGRQLTSSAFPTMERTLRPSILLSTSIVYKPGDLVPEEISAFAAWRKTLFDASVEGIEDAILRSTNPKTLFKLSTTLISQALSAYNDKHMDADVLKSGVSYFTEQLLSWTLVGVIKNLLREILQKDFSSQAHLEVLQVLVQSPDCPSTVLLLVANGVLALVNDPKALSAGQGQDGSFNPAVLRAIAEKALGMSAEDPSKTFGQTFSLNSQVMWMDWPQKHVRDALSVSRMRRVPPLDIPRCVAISGATGFLRLLWDEVASFAAGATQMQLNSTGATEIARRLLTYALVFPHPTELVPPLLPVFLHNVLPGVLNKVDGMIPGPEQTVGIELLVAVIASALTGAFHIEWAMRTVSSGTGTGNGSANGTGSSANGSGPGVGARGRVPPSQPSSSIARRLATDLKRCNSPAASIILQRLSSSQSFVANFPMMAA